MGKHRRPVVPNRMRAVPHLFRAGAAPVHASESACYAALRSSSLQRDRCLARFDNCMPRSARAVTERSTNRPKTGETGGDRFAATATTTNHCIDFALSVDLTVTRGRRASYRSSYPRDRQFLEFNWESRVSLRRENFFSVLACIRQFGDGCARPKSGSQTPRFRPELMGGNSEPAGRGDRHVSRSGSGRKAKLVALLGSADGKVGQARDAEAARQDAVRRF